MATSSLCKRMQTCKLILGLPQGHGVGKVFGGPLRVPSLGDFIFDDAFYDEKGYNPQPAGCWIPQDAGLGLSPKATTETYHPKLPQTNNISC